MPTFQSTSAVLPMNRTVENAPPTASFCLIRDAAQLQAILPEWEALWRSSAVAEPMRSPIWLMTWWRHYGEPNGWALRVGVFRSAGQIVAVAPMCVRRVWHRPGLPMKRLTFLGADHDDHDGVCSEYLDITTKAGDEAAGVRLFLNAVLAGEFGPWDELILPALDGSTATVERFSNAFTSAGLTVTQRTTTEAPYLTLPATWDAYLKQLSKKRRYNITSALRDFEKWAAGNWQLHRVENDADLALGSRILRDLHNQRWQEGEGTRGAFDSPRFQAFHHDLMASLLDIGALDLYWLTVYGEPVAAQYQFHVNGKTTFYQCGRKLDVPDRVRIGIVMNALVVQQAIQRGDYEFDFLGGAAQYKTRFTETTRPIVELRIVPNGPREWLRVQGEKLVDFARRIRNVIKPRPPKPADTTTPTVNFD